MTKLDAALNELISALNEEPLIIEFEKARMLVNSDVFLLTSEKTLKSLQQLMTKNVLDKAKHEEYKSAYNALKESYDTHPYVVNYNALLNDVNELFLTLKSIIE